MFDERNREREKFFYRSPNHIKVTRGYFATLAMAKLTFMRIYEKIRLGDHSTFKVTAAFHANIRNWLPTPRTFNWFQPFRLRSDDFFILVRPEIGVKNNKPDVPPAVRPRDEIYRLIRSSCKEYSRARCYRG